MNTKRLNMGKPPNYKKTLRELTEQVRRYLYLLDKEMETPRPGPGERGRHLGKLSNALEILNDSVRYGILGIDFRKDKPYKEEE